jgi:hypothetical protein
MAENKSTQKSGINEGGDNISSISNLLNIITNAFKLPKTGVTPLPPPLISFGGNLRTGLSSRDIAARIISRQSQAGAPVGDIYDSTNNISEAMEVIRVEEIINAIHTESKVEVVIPPGVPIAGVGPGNYGAPVFIQGVTTSLGVGTGVIR